MAPSTPSSPTGHPGHTQLRYFTSFVYWVSGDAGNYKNKTPYDGSAHFLSLSRVTSLWGVYNPASSVRTQSFRRSVTKVEKSRCTSRLSTFGKSTYLVSELSLMSSTKAYLKVRQSIQDFGWSVCTMMVEGFMTPFSFTDVSCKCHNYYLRSSDSLFAEAEIEVWMQCFTMTIAYHLLCRVRLWGVFRWSYLVMGYTFYPKVTFSLSAPLRSAPRMYTQSLLVSGPQGVS